MKAYMQFLRRFFSLILLFYPRSYRDEYGRELQAVFDLSLDEVATKGGFEIGKQVLRELVSLPKAILLEHLRQRRRLAMLGNITSRFDFAPGTRSEIWAALAPFLLFGAVSTLLDYFNVSDFVPLWLDIGFVIVLWSFGLSLLVIGFIKRFPRWFMPYIGVPMPVVCLLLFNSLMEKWQGVWWYRLPWFLSSFVQEGLFWMSLVFMLVLWLVLTRLIPKSRPFHQRLRDDWTLISFILYGVTPLLCSFRSMSIRMRNYSCSWRC